ncbi:MAG: hypothetical protein K0R51_2282 [Cytophagaceae bacterium]|nr:hypothetical protein [Cytophagaceae bacterium]
MSDTNKEFFFNEFYFLIALLAVTVATLFPFIFTGFATGDDIQYYVTYHTRDIWDMGFRYAQGNGRFYFAFMMPIFYEWLPYVLDSYTAPKFINVILIALNYFLFALIIKEVLNNKWIGFLCYLIGMVLISIKGVNNPIVSYPIYFSLSFSLILYSLYTAIKYQHTLLRKYKWYSVISFALGLLFYENYLIYLPLIVGFIAYPQLANKEDGWFLRFKKSFVTVLPFSIVVVLYMAAYISWRLIYNEYSYGGAMLSKENTLLDFLNTITSLSKGAYPLFFYFSGHSIFQENSYLLGNHVHGLPNVFINMKLEWFFKAVIVGLLFYYIIEKMHAVNKRKLLYTSIVGVVFIYTPQLLLASTEKYMSLVKCCGLTNYLTTYFSFFPVAMLLGFVLLLPLFSITSQNLLTYYKIFITVLIGMASIVNDYTNDHAVRDLRNTLYTFEAMDEFVKTKEFKTIPDTCFIYAPQLYKSNSEISYMFAQYYDWSDYFGIKSGKKIVVPSAPEEFNPNGTDIKNFYYLNYGHNRKTVDQFFALAKLNEYPAHAVDLPVLSDSVTVFYYSTYKTFSIVLQTKDIPSDSVIIVNGKSYPMKNDYIELVLRYKNNKDLFKPITIKAKNIDVKSLTVMHNSNSLGTAVELEY